MGSPSVAIGGARIGPGGVWIAAVPDSRLRVFPHHRWRLFSACHLRHSRISGPLFPYTGSLDGLRTLAIRLAASVHCRVSVHSSYVPSFGYAPTTRKFLLATINLWPVPAGRTSTSPALSEDTRPLSPPHSILAVPRATPITSWI